MNEQIKCTMRLSGLTELDCVSSEVCSLLLCSSRTNWRWKGNKQYNQLIARSSG